MEGFPIIDFVLCDVLIQDWLEIINLDSMQLKNFYEDSGIHQTRVLGVDLGEEVLKFAKKELHLLVLSIVLASSGRTRRWAICTS